jgi:outer membrane protein assembly factor BamB
MEKPRVNHHPPMAHRPPTSGGRMPPRQGAIVLAAALAVAIGALLVVGRPGGSSSPISVVNGSPTGAAGSGRPAAGDATVRPSGGSPAGSATLKGTPAAVASQPPAATPVPSARVNAGPFAGNLLIADRQNGRIIIVDTAGTIRWRFPVAGSLRPGQGFAADDAFLAPDGRSIVANEEGHEVIVRIDIATRRIVWQYGRFNVAGRGPGELHTPDDAYPLANGDVIVADIGNCRVVQISPAKHIVRQWGRTGVCTDHAPYTYGSPNGDTPLPDGGLLITEIRGSRVVRLDAAGHVVFDIHVPTAYPSDAHLDGKGNILVVDYSNPGAIIRLDRHGHVLWRYAPRSGSGRLDHPSLAIDLTNGLVAVNDDFRHRVLIIDPRTNKIVWQYGHTDHHSRANGYLFTPDGIDEIPPSVAAGL